MTAKAMGTFRIWGPVASRAKLECDDRLSAFQIRPSGPAKIRQLSHESGRFAHVKRTFQEKLGIDFRNYRILGACNPRLAYEALQLEDKVGTMLPCNVVVQEIV